MSGLHAFNGYLLNNGLYYRLLGNIPVMVFNTLSSHRANG